MTVRKVRVPFLFASAACFLIAQTAGATPQFAKATGAACSQCHQDPKPGANLTPFGQAFKANGFKLPAAASGSPPAKPTP